jgi:hypothetical protein
VLTLMHTPTIVTAVVQYTTGSATRSLAA